MLALVIFLSLLLFVDSPFGVIPILEFLETGKKMSSSIGIARMFAEQFGKVKIRCKSELYTQVLLNVCSILHANDWIDGMHTPSKVMSELTMAHNYLPWHVIIYFTCRWTS